MLCVRGGGMGTIDSVVGSLCGVLCVMVILRCVGLGAMFERLVIDSAFQILALSS